MLPYSAGLVLDNSNYYSIVKTETLLGFGSKNQGDFLNNVKIKEPLQWVLTRRNLEKSITGALKAETTTEKTSQRDKRDLGKKFKKKGKLGDKNRKCVYKIYRKKNQRNKSNMRKQYLVPMMVGLMAAKSLLIPVALKVLAFISAKGLMMGFFSTIMASLLSLKGMFDHSHGYQNRKDDTKTQVEIIQVPSHSDDHIYHEDHYSRGDYLPIQQGATVG